MRCQRKASYSLRLMEFRIAPRHLPQRCSRHLRLHIHLHIPALRIRRRKMQPHPGEMLIQTGTQRSSLVLTWHHIRQQQHLRGSQSQAHGICTQPIMPACLQAVVCGTNRRNSLHAKCATDPGLQEILQAMNSRFRVPVIFPALANANRHTLRSQYLAGETGWE